PEPAAASDLRLHVETVPSGQGEAVATRLQFASADAVRRAGLKTIVVRRESLDEYIEGVGVVGYDQTRRAQLSCRLPGVVWRVEKFLGERVKKDEVLAIIDSLEVGRLKADFLQAVSQVEVKTQIRNSLSESVTAVNQIRRTELELREAKT